MKRVVICSTITLAVIVLLMALSLSPAAQARPTPTSSASVLLSPLCPTPTQPSPVTVTNFQAGDSTEFITGIIVGLALTLVCVGVMRWLAGSGHSAEGEDTVMGYRELD